MKVCKDCVNHSGKSCSKFGGEYPPLSPLAETCKKYEEAVEDNTEEVKVETVTNLVVEENVKEVKTEEVKPKKSYREFLKGYMKKVGRMRGIGKAWKEYKNK
jgi:hypothetical protein